MPSQSTRPYRGVQPADRLARRRARLLDAGLSILGAESEPEGLTVRGVCRNAGVAARYFYESFTDKDEFVGAVFDWVIADLAATKRYGSQGCGIRQFRHFHFILRWYHEIRDVRGRHRLHRRCIYRRRLHGHWLHRH